MEAFQRLLNVLAQAQPGEPYRIARKAVEDYFAARIREQSIADLKNRLDAANEQWERLREDIKRSLQ